MGEPVVRNNVERQRYEVLVDGDVVGFADYRVHDQTVVLPHTVVDPRRRGQGLAAVLVGHMLDDLARSGRTVLPACSYVADYLTRHPDVRAALGLA